MVDAKTGLIHTVAGDGTPGDTQQRRRRRAGDQRAPEHAERRRGRSATATSTSPTCTTTACARSTRRRASSRPSPAAASGATRATTGRRRRRSWRARRASPSCNEPGGKVTIFIADFYNGHVRAVGPDGIIRDLSDEGREAFGAPTRVALRSAARLALRRRLEPGPGRAADHPEDRAEPGAAAAGAAAAEGGRMTRAAEPDPPK